MVAFKVIEGSQFTRLVDPEPKGDVDLLVRDGGDVAHGIIRYLVVGPTQSGLLKSRAPESLGAEVTRRTRYRGESPMRALPNAPER